MKVLFNCHVPFMLAHGGAQVQIEQTMAALEKTGVTVEPLRWWDETQTGDVLQHFGRFPTDLIRRAQQKGMKVVVLDLLTEQGSRSPARLKLQKILRRIMVLALPRRRLALFNWDSFRQADACLAGTEWEVSLLQDLYGAPPVKTHVLSNGVEDVFLNSQPVKRGPWLVCTATITERKRALELAEAAVHAQTPLWVIGKPYSESDSYSQRFLEFCKTHSQTIRYEGPIQDRARLAQVYREARGFVLLSTMESLSLSSFEAAACECPLLLSRLPWATTVFGEGASYCPISSSTSETAAYLRQFYDAAPGLPPPLKPPTWLEVGQQLKRLYEALLNSSR
jgi:glycosyltransferase involved in cell wall biosynthesis